MAKGTVMIPGTLMLIELADLEEILTALSKVTFVDSVWAGDKKKYFQPYFVSCEVQYGGQLFQIGFNPVDINPALVDLGYICKNSYTGVIICSHRI